MLLVLLKKCEELLQCIAVFLCTITLKMLSSYPYCSQNGQNSIVLAVLSAIRLNNHNILGPEC